MEAKKTVSTPSIVILSKDLQGEIVGIKNTGDEAVNLEGWQLISTEGNQVFTFPNMDLEAGKTIYITSGPSAKEGHGYIWLLGSSGFSATLAAQLGLPFSFARASISCSCCS